MGDYRKIFTNYLFSDDFLINNKLAKGSKDEQGGKTFI
ncbi:hypothetical protein yinte0001_15900 [Yersinia intermedia ATCC 29909]|nr:hypothetical protein yinte0001_15900 [Yersinia intermedia ATCC 29909]